MWNQVLGAMLGLVLSFACHALPDEVEVSARPPGAAAFPVELSIDQALQLLLARAVGVQTQQLDLRLQLEQAALAPREFLPQGTLAGQTERSRATGAAVDSQNAAATLNSTWKLRTGAVLSAAVGGTVVKSPETALITGRPLQSTRTVTQSIGLTQPLLRGAGTGVATLNERQAGLAATGARLGFRQGLNDIVLNAVSAYFALEQARRNVELARDTRARLGQVRAVNEALLTTGRIPRTALLQNDVDQAQAELALAQALQAEKVAQRTLLRSLGLYEYDSDRTAVVLRDSFIQHLDDTDLDEDAAVTDALAERIDLQQARDALTSANLALSAAQDALNDQLDLYVKLDRQRAAVLENGSAVNRTVGLSFSRVLDKSTLRVGVSAARAAVTKAELALDESRRLVTTDVRDAVKAIDFSRQQQRMAQRTAELAAQRMDDEVLKARAGRSSATELTQVQDAVRDARFQAVQAQYAVFLARLELQRVTGRVLEQWGVAAQTQAMINANP